MQSARIEVVTSTSDFVDVLLDATYLASGVTKDFQDGGMMTLIPFMAQFPSLG